MPYIKKRGSEVEAYLIVFDHGYLPTIPQTKRRRRLGVNKP